MNVIREFQTIFKRKHAINNKILRVQRISKASLERLNSLGYVVIIVSK